MERLLLEAGDALLKEDGGNIILEAVVYADAGAWTVAGTAAGFVMNRLTAEAGSYAATGTAVTFGRTSGLSAGVASYVTTGTAASLEQDHALDVEAGAFAVTGTAAGFLMYRLSVGAGSFVVTGAALSFPTRDIEERIRARLATSLIALVGARVYPTEVPQRATLPAVTYVRLDSDRSHAMGADTGNVHARFNVGYWDTNYLNAVTGAGEIKTAMSRFTAPHGSVEDCFFEGERQEHDPERGAYSISLDFRVHYRE